MPAFHIWYLKKFDLDLKGFFSCVVDLIIINFYNFWIVFWLLFFHLCPILLLYKFHMKDTRPKNILQIY